jgi:DNA-3-methyladenine glycosylase II
MAALAGRDISKLKAKGGGKWKYMSEKDMLEMAEKFAPYRCVYPSTNHIKSEREREPLLTLP